MHLGLTDAGGHWCLPCLWVVSPLSSSSNACVGSLATNAMQCCSACLKCQSGVFTVGLRLPSSAGLGDSCISDSGEVGVTVTHSQSIATVRTLSVGFADAQDSSRSKCLLPMPAASNFLALVVKVHCPSTSRGASPSSEGTLSEQVCFVTAQAEPLAPF